MLYLTLIICLGLIAGVFFSHKKIIEVEYISFGEFVPHIFNLFISGFSLLIIRSEGLIQIAAGNPDPYTSLSTLFLAIFVFVVAQFLITFFNVSTRTVEEKVEEMSDVGGGDEG